VNRQSYMAGYNAARVSSNPALAERWIDRGLESGVGDWQFHRIKGDFHRSRGEWLEARDRYEKAIALAPHEDIPLAMLARVTMHFREFDVAVRLLRRAIELAPRKAPWHVYLGTCELKLGNLAAARRAFAQAEALDPKQAQRRMIADIDRRIASGKITTEATQGFYDDVYAGDGAYLEPWRKTPYAETWKGIAQLLETNGSRSILDLGCGPGQFAECVAELLPNATYHGVDFSSVAVERGKVRVPSYQFSRVVLPAESYVQFAPFDTVVCTEVLEHVDADIDVLKPIPSDTYVVFSVPNFDSFGHVRVFSSEEAVRSRYGDLFRNLDVRPFKLNAASILWLGHGIRA
jgi:predicted TPR repeat methyltransferase